MKEVFIIIPTLNPNIELLEDFLKNLKKEFNNILLFDDGCRDEYKDYFKKCEKNNIKVLHHHINLGKGRALKDAFNYILVNYPDIKGVVCADSDGQHSVKDIKTCAKLILKHPHDLILGCRDFDSPNVPLKNKTGNKLTRKVFKFFVGLNITDTQTGLRGLSREVMTKYLDTKGERFEYENNQLIDTIDKNIKITEYTIDTIYNEEVTSESHFNPIKDSIAIYKTFIKYIFSAISSCVIDIILFAIFNSIIGVILYSTILARIISSIYNYLINAKKVFKNSDKYSMIKYGILVIIQMFVSGYLTTYLVDLFNMNKYVVVIKLIVDTIIFIVNFIIQKKFIFGGKHEK